MSAALSLRGGTALACTGLAAAACVPMFGNAYATTFVFTILIAYILAQSWDWIAGEMGYVNLGHYCFYGIGAYAFSIALVAKYPVLLALLFCVAFTAIVAMLLSFPLFRLKGDYFAFATLALLPLAENPGLQPQRYHQRGGWNFVAPAKRLKYCVLGCARCLRRCRLFNRMAQSSAFWLCTKKYP